MAITISSCTDCGNDPSVIVSLTESWYMICQKCGVGTAEECSFTEAVNAWNDLNKAEDE